MRRAGLVPMLQDLWGGRWEFNTTALPCPARELLTASAIDTSTILVLYSWYYASYRKLSSLQGGIYILLSPVCCSCIIPLSLYSSCSFCARITILLCLSILWVVFYSVCVLLPNMAQSMFATIRKEESRWRGCSHVVVDYGNSGPDCHRETRFTLRHNVS